MWAGGPGHYILLHDDYSLAFQAITSGETKDKDTFGGAKAEDAGVTSVYLGPQPALAWQSNLSVQLAADLPVSIQNTAPPNRPGLPDPRQFHLAFLSEDFHRM